MINFRNNMMAKILSFVGAIFLWVYIMNEENPMTEVSYEVPVSIVNLDSSYLVSDAPKSVKVKLRGPRNSLLGIYESSLKASLDLAGHGEGVFDLPIRFLPPSGVYVESQTPSSAKITVDAYASREVQVEFKGIGKINKDIKVKSAKPAPTYVTISGAKRFVDQVAKAYLIVNLEDKKGEFTAVGNIALADASGNEIHGLYITPEHGQALVVLDKNWETRKTQVSGVVIGKPSSGLEVKQVTTIPGEVNVMGLPSLLNDVTQVNTVPIVVDAAQTSFEGDYPLQQVEGLLFEQPQVRVRIEIGPTQGDKNAKDN